MNDYLSLSLVRQNDKRELHGGVTTKTCR